MKAHHPHFLTGPSTKFVAKTSWAAAEGASGRVQGWDRGSRQSLRSSWTRSGRGPLLTLELSYQTWSWVQASPSSILTQDWSECPCRCMACRRFRIEGIGQPWMLLLHLCSYFFSKSLCQSSWNLTRLKICFKKVDCERLKILQSVLCNFYQLFIN